MLLLLLAGVLLVLVQGSEVEVAVLAQQLLQLQPLLDLLPQDLEDPGACSSSCPDVSAGQGSWGSSARLVVGPERARLIVQVSGKMRGGCERWTR